MKQSLVLFLMLFFLGAGTSCCFSESGAPLFSDLLHDFSPVAGEIRSVDTGSIIIDLGASDGITAGDLFQVYRKGAPVPRADGAGVIGYLKQPFAVLRVEQPSGTTSSRCILIQTHGRVRRGMPVMRFSDMTAALVTQPGMKISSTVRKRFSDTLPALRWLDRDLITGPVTDAASMEAMGLDLLFSLSTESLDVYGPGYTIIHSYGLSGGYIAFSADTGKTVSVHSTGSKVASAEVKPPALDSAAAFQWSSRDMASAVDLREVQIAGRLSLSATQVDIVDMDGNGTLEAVYLVPRTLYVVPFKSTGPLLTWEVEGPGRAVGFYVSGTGGWIVVNVLVDGVGLRSALLRYRAGSLYAVQQDINLWLSFHDLKGGSSKDTLLGQTFDLRKIWGDDIYTLEVSSEGVEYLEKLYLPEDFRTGWAVWSDMDDNGHAELVIIDRSGQVWIYEEGILRWSSPGSLIRPGHRGQSMLPLLLSNIYHTRGYDLLFPASLHEHGELTGEIIYCITWEGERFRIRPLTKSVDAGITGISVVDKYLLVAATADVPEGDEEREHETILYELSIPCRDN